MFTVIVSVIIISIAIFAIVSEVREAKYEYCCIEIFPIGLAIVSAIGASAFSIFVEKGCIGFEKWQAIGLVLIVAVFALVWTKLEFKRDISFTIYPWISTITNLVVFAAAGVVACL